MINDPLIDEKFMRAALREAELAAQEDESPVGAVIVYQNQIIGKGHNLREKLQDPTAHAEILAITAAASHLRSWRLLDCTLYVTLEPCPMCAGALVLSRISRLVYGASDPKAGACGSLFSIQQDDRLNHRIPTTANVLAEECASLLTQFFANKRAT